MRVSHRVHLILLLATAFAVPTLADTDPSLSQVNEAVRKHLDLNKLATAAAGTFQQDSVARL